MVFKNESVIGDVTIKKLPVSTYKGKSVFYDQSISKSFGSRFSFRPFVQTNNEKKIVKVKK